ncbi:transcription/translation regulatory transformer protein RfaH [Ectothiorhodospira variabilis]|uniref:transcription/translation regulatory transformer protein RfaH n=1 Tax=Ectothiorhodospira variabilis TaxID=505694 RepID=UPI001EFB47A6|nr:transcription/translation regulatory transformer protein RfaH [Ectothiorhodospira variabilis]MCG5495776.1 transcription/translation regulatory transformer protein RfaH [Ectothiorhodospira variabilis]MCG5505197.1 transcription/translation regulatory transformer protein RfaH [Ectothiorhodospira variabilis]MCG5508366.1 transcription/translation regulatory transformer protein RfaH [Ectothiorhodospira variabilis]
MHHCWYLVFCKPRREMQAADSLEEQDYAVYLPRLRRRARRARGTLELEEPLFPRYLFVSPTHDEQSLAPIRSTRGVSHLVRFGGQCVPVDGALIEALKQREDPHTGCHHLYPPTLRPGQRVMITSGPLAGMEAIFQAQNSEERVIVLLDCLGRGTRTQVDRQAIAV